MQPCWTLPMCSKTAALLLSSPPLAQIQLLTLALQLPAGTAAQLLEIMGFQQQYLSSKFYIAGHIGLTVPVDVAITRSSATRMGHAAAATPRTATASASTAAAVAGTGICNTACCSSDTKFPKAERS